MGTTMTVLLLLAMASVLVMNIYLLSKSRKEGVTRKIKLEGTPHRLGFYADDDIDSGRFHLAPLGNLDEEYLNLFSNPPMDKAARRGKSAYLRDAYHERIRQIVNALNIEGVNISTYVDMVLTDHLMRYEDQIDHLLHNCYGKPKTLAN